MVEDLALDAWRVGIRSFIRLRQRIRVLLPQPEGPISAVISFCVDVHRDVLDRRLAGVARRSRPRSSKTFSAGRPSASGRDRRTFRDARHVDLGLLRAGSRLSLPSRLVSHSSITVDRRFRRSVVTSVTTAARIGCAARSRTSSSPAARSASGSTPGRGDDLELVLGPQRVVEDLDRHRRVAAGEGLGVEGDEGRRTDEQQRRRLADRARQRQDDAGGDPRESRPAGPDGGSSATGSRPARATPRGSKAAPRGSPRGAAMITVGSTRSARVREPGRDDEAEAERPANDEGEAEDPVDDRGHGRQVLDVELDQPVPPARPCPRTPPGRRPRRRRAARPGGSPRRSGRGVPMIAGRNPAFSGKIVDGPVGDQVRSRTTESP